VIANDTLYRMHEIIIFTAVYAIAIPIVCLAYIIYTLEVSERRKLFVILIVGGIVSILLSKLAGFIYSDPRPFFADHVIPFITTPTDNGFPSDHTLLSAFLGFVVLYASKKLGVGLLILAALIGIARVAAGVHHAPDVVGGFMAATVSFGIAYVVLQYYYLRRNVTAPKA